MPVTTRFIAGAVALAMTALGSISANALDDVTVTIKGEFPTSKGDAPTQKLDTVVKLVGNQLSYTVGSNTWTLPLGGQAVKKKPYYCDDRPYPNRITSVVSANVEGSMIRIKVNEFGAHTSGACSGKVKMDDTFNISLANDKCMFSYTRSFEQEGTIIRIAWEVAVTQQNCSATPRLIPRTADATPTISRTTDPTDDRLCIEPENISKDCANESGVKSCTCVVLRNKCARPIKVTWKVSSASPGSEEIAGKKRDQPASSKQICTSAKSQKIERWGTFRPRY